MTEQTTAKISDTSRSCFECNFNYRGGIHCPNCHAPTGEPIGAVSRAGEQLEQANPDAILFCGFDGALMGFAYRCGLNPVALYDREVCIKILVDRDGMTGSEAEDFFEYNVAGLWAGEGTPLIAELG